MKHVILLAIVVDSPDQFCANKVGDGVLISAKTDTCFESRAQIPDGPLAVAVTSYLEPSLIAIHESLCKKLIAATGIAA